MMCESALLTSVPFNVIKKTDGVVEVSLVTHTLFLDVIDIYFKMCFRTALLITKRGNAEGANSALFFFIFVFSPLPVLPNPM